MKGKGLIRGQGGIGFNGFGGGFRGVITSKVKINNGLLS